MAFKGPEGDGASADNLHMTSAEPSATLVLRSPWGPMQAQWGPKGLRELRTAFETPEAEQVLPPEGKALEAWLMGYGAPRTGYTTPPLVLDDSCGTPLQRIVWKVLRSLVWGQTLSYAALAERVAEAGQHPAWARSVRAVATAVGNNPWWVLVPCHRVVGSDGRLRGYAGGLAMKADLLRREGWALTGSEVQDRLIGRT